MRHLPPTGREHAGTSSMAPGAVALRSPPCFPQRKASCKDSSFHVRRACKASTSDGRRYVASGGRIGARSSSIRSIEVRIRVLFFL